MAEFLETEAIDIDVSNTEIEGECITTVSDQEFIDDDDNEQCEYPYPYFANVNKS